MKQEESMLQSNDLGIMNIQINGIEITNRQFMPGTQQYDKRLMIETIEMHLDRKKRLEAALNLLLNK